MDDLIRPINLTDQLYGIFKNNILKHIWKPGEKITIQKCAKDFKVSHTPVREVFNRLVMDELLNTSPNKGYYVIKLSSQDIKDIYEYRKMIECYVLKKFGSRFNKDELTKIQNKIDNVKSLLNSKKELNVIEDYYSFILNFHMDLVAKSENKLIISNYLKIMDRIRLVLGQDREYKLYNISLKRHSDIINNLKSKDYDKASKILSEHINYSCKFRISKLKS